MCRAVFLLVRSPEERTFHLRALSAIAQIVQDPAFEDKWSRAWGVEELRRIILEAERRRCGEALVEEGPTGANGEEKPAPEVGRGPS